MICFKCDSEEFDLHETIVRQEFRGEQLFLRANVAVCRHCGWQTLGPGQADEIRKLAADEYRRRHNLLTSREITVLRKLKGMTQKQFAKFIGVGEASIKRWENGFVQEVVYDQIIRQKCGQVNFRYADMLMAAGSAAKMHVCITNSMVNVVSDYMAQPIKIPFSVSQFTNDLIGDEQLAVVSKKWRKEHSVNLDTDFIQCQ